MSKFFYTSFLLLFLVSCGGDEAEPIESPSDDTTPEVKPEQAPVVVAEPEEEPEPIPNPNGVYLPTGEEKNGKPVYANGEGFFMWFNGSLWKISDKSGGGKIISSGQESINDKWSGGGKARHFPDEEFRTPVPSR